jgi:DTW domain-containing protein YfiP
VFFNRVKLEQVSHFTYSEVKKFVLLLEGSCEYRGDCVVRVMGLKITSRPSIIIQCVSFSLWSRFTHSFRIVLLTHNNEESRPTNTGKLLLKRGLLTEENTVPSALAELLVWEGRGDNAKTSEALLRLHEPVLIWTDAQQVLQNSVTSLSPSDPTYIILDGTWQEAKKMFRQGPECLRSMPRMSLEPTFRSNYKLRGNFGYVDRFSPIQTTKDISEEGRAKSEASHADSNLLCTVEVGACLLMKHGQEENANALLNQLEEFQMSFQCYSTSKRIKDG